MEGSREPPSGPASTITITSRQRDLIELRTDAAVLLDVLRVQAEHLRSNRHRIELLENPGYQVVIDGIDCRADRSREARQIEAHLWKAARDSIERLKKLVWEVCRLMPEVGANLRHLPGCKAHDLDNKAFDLEPVLTELRLVVAQAVHHSGLPGNLLFEGRKRLVIGDEFEGNSEPATPADPAGSQPTRAAPAGRTVAADDLESRKLVAERYDQFKREYKTLGYNRDSYENFAAWSSDQFDDMPSDDPDELKRMVDAYRKTPTPRNLV